MGTAVVLLVAIPYIIVFKSLTSSEQENKYEQAHRWFVDLKNWYKFSDFSDLLALDLLFWLCQKSSYSWRAIHWGDIHRLHSSSPAKVWENMIKGREELHVVIFTGVIWRRTQKRSFPGWDMFCRGVSTGAKRNFPRNKLWFLPQKSKSRLLMRREKREV